MIITAMADRRQRFSLFLLLLALGVALAACAQLAGQPSPTNAPLTRQPPSTTTTTPVGSRPAPSTSTPTPSRRAAAPCTIVVRTPPPSAPTTSAMGTALPQRVDPHVELCASSTTVKVGETVTVVGQSVDIGFPYYDVRLKDQGAADFALLTEVTYLNQVKSRADVSQVLGLVSVEGQGDDLVVILRARGAGRTQLVASAEGEVHFGYNSYNGPAMFLTGVSDPITITVTLP
jgi:hypothetical protein